jgi:hypothetical protein
MAMVLTTGLCVAQQATGYGIEVSAGIGGTLYFQDEELAVLRDGDTYTIPVERPGTYTVELALGNGATLIRAAPVTAGSTAKINFSSIEIGDRGPGGGIVFFAEGGRYMEVSGILGEHTWSTALTVARNHRGGGFSDWRLPTRDELNLLCKNLRAKNIDNSGDRWHWSSSEYNDGLAWSQRFSGGYQVGNLKTDTGSVRAVRAF